MNPFPFYCADCSFVPANFEEDPRPCPRCGSVEFRRGSLLVKVKMPMARMTIGPPTGGMLQRAFEAGPTDGDRRFLRNCRIGW